MPAIVWSWLRADNDPYAPARTRLYPLVLMAVQKTRSESGERRKVFERSLRVCQRRQDGKVECNEGGSLRHPPGPPRMRPRDRRRANRNRLGIIL